MLKKIIVGAIALCLIATGAHAAFYSWSTTASSNSTADATINWAEGMAPSAVNDSARAMMARLAEFRDDTSGKLTTGGTSTAYTVTTNQVLASTPTNGQYLVITPHATNGASATLQADGGTAYAIQTEPGTAATSGVMRAGTPYGLKFNSSASAWILHNFYTVSVNLDSIGSTRGSILERGSAGWQIVTPGATGTVWTSNGAGADPSYQALTILPQPQGYLTPTSGTAVITGDVSAATTIYYTPYVGNSIPIYNGSVFVSTTFSELSLSLSSSQSASGIYDVFVFSDAGTVRAVFGPSWSAGGGSVAAGSSSRGSGAGSTALTRLSGIWVNNVSMSGLNGATTYSVAANQGTYVGSVYIDGSAGQVSLHRTYGQSRKWGIWNAYNRQQIVLRAGDSTASWSYSTASYRQANATAGNTAAAFMGLAEEPVRATYNSRSTGNISQVAIGVNSTTTRTGTSGYTSSNDALHGRYSAPPALGLNNYNALEQSVSGGAVTFFGTEESMLLELSYRG